MHQIAPLKKKILGEHAPKPPSYDPVVCSKLLLINIYNPSDRFWRSTLIDLGAPRKKLCGLFNYPPPPRMYILELV